MPNGSTDGNRSPSKISWQHAYRIIKLTANIAAILIPIWFLFVSVLTFIPTCAIKLALRPTAWIFRILGKITYHVRRYSNLSGIITSILPIRNLLGYFNLGYTDLELTQIETGIFIYLVVEGVCYYLYTRRVREMIQQPPRRSNVDMSMMIRLADQFVSDTTPEDIVKFIVYAFYCLSEADTSGYQPSEDISDPSSVWHGHYKLSQRYCLDFPLLTKDDLVSYLQENLGLEDWHAHCLLKRIEEKIDTVFPECVTEEELEELETKSESHGSPRYPKRPLTPLVNKARVNNYTFPRFPPTKLAPVTEHTVFEDVCAEDDSPGASSQIYGSMAETKKKVSSSLHSYVADRAFVYGANGLTPHYRPIFVCILIHTIHQIVSRLIMPSLGFARYRSLRHDMRTVLGFYVLYPKDSPKTSPENIRPLLMVHGFGCGIVPYITVIFYMVKHYKRVLFDPKGLDEELYRPIIIPEMRYLGLLPNGGITIRWALQAGLSLFSDTCTKFRGFLKKVRESNLLNLVTNEDVNQIKITITQNGKKQNIRPKWDDTAPHIHLKKANSSSSTNVYLPTMPEVVDEMASFIRFVSHNMINHDVASGKLTWIKDRDTPILFRMFGKAILPVLRHRRDYETRSYRNFWMKTPRNKPKYSPKLITPKHSPGRSPSDSAYEMFEPKAFGDVDFLNPAKDPEDIQLSRHEFLTRCRLMASEMSSPKRTLADESPIADTDRSQESVAEIMTSLKERIHDWFEPGKGGGIMKSATPRTPYDPLLWDYTTCNDSPEAILDTFEFNLWAHSYGTAVASCILKSYTNSVKQVVLLDPICWIVQLTKKAQLCALPPWKVKLFDRSYSPQSVTYISSSSWTNVYSKFGVNAVDLNGRPIEAISFFHRWISIIAWLFHHVPTWLDWALDRVLLYIYWYGVYRDFGTRWTTGRQFQGHEYIDDGILGRLAEEKRLMVVLGLKDLIVSSHSIVQHLNTKPEGSRPKMIVNNDHHGICLVRKEVLDAVNRFIEAS